MQRTDAVIVRLLFTTTLTVLVGCGAGQDSRSAPDASRESVWQSGPGLPQPLSNNAVAAVTIDGRTSVFTFGGIDSTRSWSGVTDAAYRWDVGTDRWEAIDPLPGPGRWRVQRGARRDSVF